MIDVTVQLIPWDRDQAAESEDSSTAMYVHDVLIDGFSYEAALLNESLSWGGERPKVGASPEVIDEYNRVLNERRPIIALDIDGFVAVVVRRPPQTLLDQFAANEFAIVKDDTLTLVVGRLKTEIVAAR